MRMPGQYLRENSFPPIWRIMNVVRPRDASRRAILVAAGAALLILALAAAVLTVLGTAGNNFDTALTAVATVLGAVGTVVGAMAAVWAVQATRQPERVSPARAHGELVPPTPTAEGIAAATARGIAAAERWETRRGDQERNDREHLRLALQPELTSGARWMCRLPPNKYLYGRDELVTSVIERMRAALNDKGTPVALLAGRPGVGTSSVATAAAHELATDFPDGVFRVDLHGLVPGARWDTGDVVELVSRALGLHLDSRLLSDDERLAALGARLDGQRVLLVLDHAKDEAHVAQLVNPPIAAGIIVTSRNLSHNYAGKRLFFKVDPLEPRPAVDMLAEFALDRRHSRRQLRQLAKLCAYVPMALDVTGRKIESGVPANLGTLISSLKQAKLDALQSDDDDAIAVRAAIRLSYDDLEDPSVRRAFLLLSAAAGCACTAAEMAYSTGQPGPHERRLQTLVRRSLAQEKTPYPSADDRAATYSLYELVNDFARERLAAEETPETILDFERNSVTFLRDRLREITAGSGPAAAAGRLDPVRYRAAELLAEERGWSDLAADLADGLHVLFLDRNQEGKATAIHDRLVQLLLAGGDFAAASAACLTAAQRLDDRGATPSAIRAATKAAEIARDHWLETDLARADARLRDLRIELDGGTAPSHG
jgi:hypothetical protein